MVKTQIEHFVLNTRQGWVYFINWTCFKYHGILRNIQLGISLRVRNQWVLMNIITIMTMMCPYFKRNTSMLKYWVYTLSRPMFPSTHSVYSETYFQTFRTKLRYLTMKARKREKKERWQPSGTLSDVTKGSTIHLHPSSLSNPTMFWL